MLMHSMKERESVLENFIFRNEYTQFIGHLERWGTLGFIFIDIRERTRSNMLQTRAISPYFLILNSSRWPEFFPLSLEQHKAPL